MGTEVQCKMNLPGYYSMREPENNGGYSAWHLNDSCRASKGHSTTGTTRDAFFQNAKAELRQTMLMHESIFRHQLNELHRIYRVQRDLMNEMKSKTTLYSSRVPCDDEKWQVIYPMDSLENFSYGRASTSIIDSIRTPSSINEIYMQSRVGPSQNGVNSNECQPVESKCKKLKRQLFDIKLPGDDYVDNQEKQPEVSEASMAKNYPSFANIGPSQKRYCDMDSGVRENSGGYTDASSSYINTRTYGSLEEVPGSASGDSLGILKSGEIGRQNLSANLSSGIQAKNNSQNFDKERNRANLSFVHPENERVQRGWSSYNYEAGNSQSDGVSFSQSSYPENYCISFKSQCENKETSEVGVTIQFDHKKIGQHHKRKIFGVEIAERNNFEYTAALQRFGLHHLCPQTDGSNLEPSTILSSEVPSSFKHSSLSTLEGSSSRASPHLSKNDTASVQRRHAAVTEKLRSALPARHKMNSNGFGKGLQFDFQDIQVLNPSSTCVQPNGIRKGNGGYELVELNSTRHPGGIDLMLKSSNNANIDVPHLQCSQIEAVSRNNLISTDGLRKQEFQQGGMPWLKARPQTSSEYGNRMEGPYSTNLDKLKNGNKIVKPGDVSFLPEDSSIVLSAKTFPHNINIGDISTPTNTLGFPVLSKPHLARELLSSSFTSQSHSFGSVINGGSIADHVNVSARLEAHIEDNLSVGGRLLNSHANIRHQFDLNLSASEEEAGAEDSSPKSLTRISAEKVEIDLDKALPLENENIETKAESRAKGKSVEQPKLSQHELEKSLKDSIWIAAETIVSISSMSMDPADDLVFYQNPEASLDNPLHWFTNTILSSNDDSRNIVGPVSVDNNDSCHEDPIPDSFDYFEYMTLKLTETQEEECIFKPEAPGTPENERSLARQPRRGQAKRRRQRKDFQRDVLPGLTSLSKYEVTEDLQTFQSLIRATGESWEPGMGHRKSSKGSAGKGRKRSRSSVPTPKKTDDGQPHIQKSTSRETSFCEGSLTGWGKRIKRLPRQRCQPGVK